MVAPSSEVPQGGSSVFSLFSLVKLHLASHPLASSYSHVAVSSVFCAQYIHISAQTREAPSMCVCVFSSHSFWTSSLLDVPAGVTQEEGHTGFLIHLLSAVRALIFLARRIQPFLSLADREVEFLVCIILRSINYIIPVLCEKLLECKIPKIEAAGNRTRIPSVTGMNSSRYTTAPFP